MTLGVIKHKGYNDFIGGTFGNAGQNIYVSKKGIIQRIHHFDINRDGYVDLPFANAQDDESCVPACIYLNPFENKECIEVSTNGAYCGAMADLNNDGYDDLVIANQYNGVSNDVYAQVYFGSHDGISEKHMLKLWAPSCTGVAIGDFNSDGMKDIAFICEDKIRIFYQEECGFRANGYVDMDIGMKVDAISADDLDGDGCYDLVVRFQNSEIKVFWGGLGGLDCNNFLAFKNLMAGNEELGSAIDKAASGAGGGLVVYKLSDSEKLKVVRLGGVPHIFTCSEDRAVFTPVNSNRSTGEQKILNSGYVTSAAVGDINGDGFEDIVLSSQQKDTDGKEFSWIYWGSESGYSNDNRIALHTISARDVVVGDIDGDGFADIVFCQQNTDELYSIESFIYKGMPTGVASDPVRLSTHCAVNAFIGNTCGAEKPQVIFINHLSNHVRGDVPSYIYLGGPQGFSNDKKIELPGWATTELRICDFNDDGFADVFLANCNENAPHLNKGSYIYMAEQDGFSEKRRIELPTINTMSSCCADINKDGYLDLIVCGYNNDEILIFYGSDNGSFSEPHRLKLDIKGVKSKEPRFMTLADFNNDGWLDLVVPMSDANYFAIFWGSEAGFNTNNVTLIAAEKTLSSRAADLDGDGWLDLVIGAHTGLDPKDPFNTFVYIYWGGPDGFSNDRRTQLPANFACDISIADFNNDGILDIFVGCYHGLRTRDLDSYIYWGNKDRIYTEKNRKHLFCHSVAGALAADFNEDGWIDLAVANHKTNGNHPGFSYVWWNGPNGFSEERLTKLPTLGPHGITHLDIGNISDRRDEEYYISKPVRIPDNACITGINWVADISPKTSVRGKLRTAATEQELKAAKWMGVSGENNWFENNSVVDGKKMSGNWVQYCLALAAVNSGNSPRVSEVNVTFEIMD